MNPDEIELEIQHTRHQLDRTLRALQYELSPRHQLEQAWRSAKYRGARSMRAGADWAKANPAPILVGTCVLIAATVGVALRQRRRHRVTA